MELECDRRARECGVMQGLSEGFVAWLVLYVSKASRASEVWGPASRVITVAYKVVPSVPSTIVKSASRLTVWIVLEDWIRIVDGVVVLSHFTCTQREEGGNKLTILSLPRAFSFVTKVRASYGIR